MQLFLLLLVFALGPLFLSNLWGYAQSRQLMVDAAFRDVRNVAAIEAAQAERSVETKRRTLPSLTAGNQHLFALMRSLGSCDSAESCEAVRSALHEHLAAKAAEDESLLELVALDTDGGVFASSSAGAPGFGRVAGLCVASASDPRMPAELQYGSEEPILVMATRVIDGSGTELGMLCGRFLFDVHSFLVTTSDEQSPGAVSYLVDGSGEILCSSLPHNEGAHVGHPIESRASLPAAGSEGWSGRYRLGHGGEEVLAAYQPVTELGWAVLTEVPVAAALSDLNRLKWQAVVFGTTLALVLMIVASLAARRMARPLTVLASAARRMSEGKLGQLVAPGGPREVSDSARAFNRMSMALTHSQERLSEEVAERTQELRRSQEFLELLINSIEQRVLVVNREGRIVMANRRAQRMQGDDVVGKSYEEVFGDPPPAVGTHPVRRTLDTGRFAMGELPQTVGTGREIVRLEVFPVHGEDGEVEAAVEVARVVTGEKQLQAQMIHQEKMATIGLLAAGMAHEIGNPLSSILAQLRMTRRSKDPERVEETLRVVEAEIQRVSRLLRELVSFARRRRDEVTRVDVNAAVRDVERLLAHDPRARDTRMRLELGQDMAAVRAEEDRVVQVLLNLGINALDAMPEGGTLTFESETRDGRVVVRVADTGTGIPPEIRESLFEPFATTKPPGKGTGLGLFVSKGVVEDLGGTLVLVRTGPEGTVFEMSLPVEDRTGRD